MLLLLLQLRHLRISRQLSTEERCGENTARKTGEAPGLSPTSVSYLVGERATIYTSFVASLWWARLSLW